MITIPKYLKPGNTIGIVCPAGYMDKEKAVTCIQVLQNWGYQVKVGTTLGGNSANYFSGSDKERVQDLQSMLDDDNVDAVLCGRGGYGTSRIIDALDFTKFRRNPKWVIGFSDITALHAHIYRNCRIATLHAPMAAAFNGQGYANEYVGSLKSALEGQPATYMVAPHTFNVPGEVTAPLVGGNLSVIVHLIGTASELKTKKRILFVEDVGEQLYSVDRMFLQLRRSGKLDKIVGLIIGGFTDLKDTERPFGKSVMEIIRAHLQDYTYPIAFDFPVSHDKENVALKIGVEHRLTVNATGVMLAEQG
ncbi:MAG: LD-carboxypeptidase [Chitinophagaceae bacterium]|nr:MAG: LD-carboxypeptidase [Chitinophagaceae bacterium]